MHTRRASPNGGEGGFHFADAMKQVEAGMAAMEAGDTEQALRLFTTAAQLDPTLTVAFVNQGFTLAQLGRFEEAMTAFEHAYANDPDNAGANYGMGLSLAEMGMEEDAVPFFVNAGELLPAETDLLASVAEQLLLVEEPESAMDVVEKGLAHDPRRGDLLLLKGRALVELGDSEQALVILRALVEQEPRDSNARYFLGMVLHELGRYDEALAVYRVLRADDPAFTPACMGEASTLLALNRQNEALAALQPLLAEANENPPLAMTIGQFFEYADDPARALEYYRKAMMLDPDEPMYYPLVIELSMRLGDQAGARQTIDRLLELDPVLGAETLLTFFPPTPARGSGALEQAFFSAAPDLPKEAILQLKVTLRGSKPPIWRRIQVPADITLEKFHGILQATMGWYDGHLHQFTIEGQDYGMSDPDGWGPPVRSEKRARLASVGLREKSRFRYEYDFGDGWEHDIVVEKVLSPEPNGRYPVCLKGKGACPPEDIGGIWGYYHFLEVMANPKDPEYDEMREWHGGDFDPDTFSCDEVNARLEHFRKKAKKKP